MVSLLYRSWLTPALLICSLAVLPLPVSGLPALQSVTQENERPVVHQYGSWKVGCTSAGEHCVMSTMGYDKNGTPRLQMTIQMLPLPQTAEGVGDVAIAEVSMPIEVVLPRGLVVNLTGKSGFVVQFQECNAVECLVREQLSEDTVKSLKAGKQAGMTFVSSMYGKVEVEVSLIGFTRAFKKLK